VSGSSNDKHGSHDKQFFDTFMLVLGSLILVAFGIYFGAKTISAHTQEAQALQDPIVQKAVTERLKPVAQVAIAGADNSAMEEKSSAPAALADMPGDQLYTSTCSACHGTGVLNAPKFGDKAAWSARIAKGMDVLHKHALEGFNNVMPAKGGNTAVSDKSVMDAVDYMVSKSK
jgi:cytochrome c5